MKALTLESTGRDIGGEVTSEGGFLVAIYQIESLLSNHHQLSSQPRINYVSSLQEALPRIRALI